MKKLPGVDRRGVWFRPKVELHQTNDAAGLKIDIDIVIRGSGGQAGHGAHRA